MKLVALLLAVAFANANQPWTFTFPRDHAAHDRFASEWWYYTGHLVAADGRRFGFELTFFRFGTRPGAGTPAPGQSRWRGNELFPAHLALTDEHGRRFVHAERFERAALGMGAASEQRLDVRVGSWTLTGPAPFRLHADDEAVGLDLTATSLKPPAVHGHDGISRKAGCRTCASHYYSLTRLRTHGTVRYRGERIAVDGIAWMDHEFGSDELQPDQVGWDWFSLQLEDGREVMLYRLRQRDGTTTPASSGSLIGRDGRVTYVPLNAFRTQATGTWTSPHTGGRYPSGWRLTLPSAKLDLVLAPVVRDQELAATTGGVSYWEGAVDVTDAATGRRAGVGYVELTGYAGALAL
jgi:predicted secreted hydrolase